MPSYEPVIKNGSGAIFNISLCDQATPGSFKASPTLAAGDFKISIDNGAFANLATLPTVTPAAGVQVKFVLSQAETNGDNLTIQCVDQTNPKEWCDALITIQTAAQQFDTLSTATAVDALPTNAELATALATADDAVLAQVALVKTKTDALPTDPADASDVAAAFAVVNAKLPAALVGGRMDASIGSVPTTTNLGRTVAAIGIGTVTTGATATSIPTSAFLPVGASLDQFAGRVVLFDTNTTTTALRGCARVISSSSNAASPTFTVGTLPAIPVSGDTFTVI